MKTIIEKQLQLRFFYVYKKEDKNIKVLVNFPLFCYNRENSKTGGVRLLPDFPVSPFCGAGKGNGYAAFSDHSFRQLERKSVNT